MLMFSSKTKLADLINANHNLILILPRFGIALGFGDKSVDEVCNKHHIDTLLFLLICHSYSFEQFSPKTEELHHLDTKGLLAYLLASHRYYLDERLPHIELHLNNLADLCEEKQQRTIKDFFSHYKNEVVHHFHYEEHIVFPYIQALLAGKQASSFNIHRFEQNHSNIEDKLSDLTNIIIKYMPGNVLPKERTNVLFDLFRLSEDLAHHANIEDKILVPHVEFLEKQKA